MEDIASKGFSFEEADHLTRIHLKLALEDVGFVVKEAATTIRIGISDANEAAAAAALAISGAPPPR